MPTSDAPPIAELRSRRGAVAEGGGLAPIVLVLALAGARPLADGADARARRAAPFR